MTRGLLLGYLMYRSELVPRRWPMLGLIAGPLIIITGVAAIFGLIKTGGPVMGIATAPEFIWELFLGVYPLVWGFNLVAPILSGSNHRRSSGAQGTPEVAPS